MVDCCTGAASVIRARLCGEPVKKHCQHCLWCLYLAALICWNYEFATTKSIRAADFIQDGRLVSPTGAQEQCQAYLSAATAAVKGQEQQQQTPSGDATLQGQGGLSGLPSTMGTLVVVTQYLESCFNIGMIQEGIDLLRRLTGLRE